MSGAGRRARRYFSRSGDLRHIKRLRFWPLHDVLREKYELPDEEVGTPPGGCSARTHHELAGLRHSVTSSGCLLAHDMAVGLRPDPTAIRWVSPVLLAVGCN